MSDKRPAWWPKNPFPEDIFTISDKGYPDIVPDDMLRTALSGALGRRFWNIASDTIWEAYKSHLEDEEHIDIEELSEDIIERMREDIFHSLGDIPPPDHYARWRKILQKTINHFLKSKGE